MAYAIARSASAQRNTWLMLVMLPFWTSFLVRVYAWMGLLDSEGLINHALLGLGLIDQPLQLLHTAFSVQLVMVYTYLPFMILPLYSNLVKLDGRLLEAAADLGCQAVAGVCQRHPALVEKRHRRRRHAGVHPGGG